MAFGRPTPGRHIGRPGVGHPQGVFGVFSNVISVMLFVDMFCLNVAFTVRVSSGVKILDSNTGYPSEMEFVRESPTFLLFGSENGGLDAHLLDWCHCHVQIHSRNKEKITCVDSLNVSVAAGIVFHHLLS
jgi:tRNA C32,U32 (ribose-2'-O)-methylase TrmJ